MIRMLSIYPPHALIFAYHEKGVKVTQGLTRSIR